MKTASFFVAGTLPGAISIARFSPRRIWFIGSRYKPLCPTSQMLKMDSVAFDFAYVAQLSALNPRRVYADLIALAEGHEPLLLCFERDRSQCHRFLVASWLEAALGVTVAEYDS